MSKKKINFQFLNFFLNFLKVLSGGFLGFTVAIIVQSLLNAGVFSVIFITLTIGMAYIKLVWHYRWIGLIACNLFFVALFLFLKLYITFSIS